MNLYRETILNEKISLIGNDLINRHSKTFLQLGK